MTHAIHRTNTQHKHCLCQKALLCVVTYVTNAQQSVKAPDISVIGLTENNLFGINTSASKRASRILGKQKQEWEPPWEFIKFVADHKTAFAPSLKGLQHCVSKASTVLFCLTLPIAQGFIK